ncbi:phosphoribosylaminoimidazolesuccinocarboxamide synthase [Rufibacter roseolus]|uniref:phosphoribosylaminoimidazolesuccinocarboxamide synthase n=1 Tax=Rufibacter roseolus TaxID=2817375 RepID=UPI001B30BB10|nr:phosphoribosylaminoimidazolesuccinocarboxamide synthase [Rufibacter roseolus]
MNPEKIFKTKTGYCHIFPDKIVLSRDGVAGSVAKVTVGNSITRILLIYGLIAAFLLYLAFDSYQDGQTTVAVLQVLLGIYLLVNVSRSLNNSAEPIIDRNRIQNIKLKKAVPGLTRSYFEVNFLNEENKIKKRLIMLPGSLSNGKEETEKAIQIMKEENLLV